MEYFTKPAGRYNCAIAKDPDFKHIVAYLILGDIQTYMDDGCRRCPTSLRLVYGNSDFDNGMEYISMLKFVLDTFWAEINGSRLFSIESSSVDLKYAYIDEIHALILPNENLDNGFAPHYRFYGFTNGVRVEMVKSTFKVRYCCHYYGEKKYSFFKETYLLEQSDFTDDNIQEELMRLADEYYKLHNEIRSHLDLSPFRKK